MNYERFLNRIELEESFEFRATTALAIAGLLLALSVLVWVAFLAPDNGVDASSLQQGIGLAATHRRVRKVQPTPHRPHPASSEDLPIVIECVDTDDKIEAVLPALDDMNGSGLITLERVEVRVYRADGDGLRHPRS